LGCALIGKKRVGEAFFVPFILRCPVGQNVRLMLGRFDIWKLFALVPGRKGRFLEDVNLDDKDVVVYPSKCKKGVYYV
jgi:hypothetical protein